MREEHVENDGKPVVVEHPVHPISRKRTFVMSPAAWFAAGGVALFIGIVGFVGGLQVGRFSNAVARNTTSRTMFGTDGRPSSRTTYPAPTTITGLNASGAITAVNASSITVKDTRTGQSVTFGITSTTSVTNANATASVSDLKVGDVVRIQSASTTSTDATRIELNPVARGRGMMGAF